MQLTQNLKGISKLAFLLLLVVFFLLGAIVSYIWTMGFYAPGEFNLPSQTNMTIEDVKFLAENATFFNVTVLNPSYSKSDAVIDRIKVSTNDGKVHSIVSTSPPMPLTLAPGKSQTIQSYWNWGNYTGQTVDVYVLIIGGSGPAIQANTAFMNFSITSVNLDPSVSVNHFNITVQNAGSSTSVNIKKILVNGSEVSTVPNLTLPYALTNASDAVPVSFMLMKNWTDLQGKTVVIEVQTSEGYTAYKTEDAPSPMVLRITDVDFNIEYMEGFNITVQNAEDSPKNFVDINEIKLLIEERTILPNIAQTFPQRLQWNSSITLTVLWNWASDEGKNVTIVVLTAQGFTIRGSASIIPKPYVSFMSWENGARTNTFDHPIVIDAQNATQTYENATHGIWNWDTTAHTVHVRILNITDSSNIQNVTIFVKLGSDIVTKVVWNNSEPLPPTSWVSFSAAESTKYTIWIEIATIPDAFVGQTSVITMEIKTDP